MNIAKTLFSVALAATVLSASAGFSSAEPVWPQGRETERNLFVGFRAKVDGRAAKLRYSASSIARVWLNGEFLAYGPARGPHGIDRIDEIDLAGRVKKGDNVLAFEVAGYNVRSYYLLDEPAYLAAEVLDREGKVLAATAAKDGAFEAFVLDERVQKVPRFSYQRPFCEAYALAPDANAWRTGGARQAVTLAKAAGSPKWIDRVFPYPDYAVSKVFKPIRAGALAVREPQPKNVGVSVYGEKDPKRGYAEGEIAVQPVYEVRRLTRGADRPVPPAGAVKFAGRDYVLLDHGLCDTGFLGARVVCTKPGRLLFHFDEVLVDGDIDVARMGWQCVNTVTYDFKQPGVYAVEAFEPNTFRYLKVMADGFSGTVDDVFLRGYKNAAALKATYSVGDPALEKIFAAARETFAQNAVDAFTDCPSRERAGWLCDSFFSARVAYLLTGRTDVEKGFLQNYMLCPKVLNGGFLPMCYPADSELLPNWNFWLILQVEEYLKRSGDRALVDAFRPKLEGILAAFRRCRNADGLLEKLPGWVFVEWSFANRLVQDVNYPSNMTYAEVLDAMARLYGLADCAAEAKKVRETVLKQSWTGEWFCDNAVRQKDGTLKLSGECTETCQYYAFYFRVATPESHPDLWKRLLADFGPQRKQTKKHPKIHFANAFVGNYLRLELLSRAGLTQQILDETKGYFLGMAEKTGTLWEHDNISNSCDHGFASHVAVWLANLPGAKLTTEAGGDEAHDGIVRRVAASDAECAARQAKLKKRATLADYRAKVRAVGGTNVWTAALQAALDENEIVTLPAAEEPYWIDGVVTIPSNRRIEAKGATVVLLPGTRTLMLRNRHCPDGTLKPVAGRRDDNIAIVGGRWEDWTRKRAGYGATGRFDMSERKHGNWFGVSTLFYFGNCDHVTVEGVTFAHTSAFSVQAGDGDAHRYADIVFDDCYADGLHLNGNLTRVHAKNVRGKVGDDLVALNAYDWLNSSVNFGPQRDILCEDLELQFKDGAGYPAIRIQPAKYRFADGSIVDCAVSDVIFRRVKGIVTFKMYLQTPGYTVGKDPEWAAVGSGGNLWFEDIVIDLTHPIDMLGQYVTSDPLRGHFGAFEFGANLTSVNFRNIDIRFHLDKWPLSHLATVGPKSILLGSYEVFDPYVDCKVGRVTVEGLTVRGKRPEELVHATVFDDVNKDGRSSGRGVIEHFTEVVR